MPDALDISAVSNTSNTSSTKAATMTATPTNEIIQTDTVQTDTVQTDTVQTDTVQTGTEPGADQPGLVLTGHECHAENGDDDLAQLKATEAER